MARSIQITDPHGLLPPLITPSIICLTHYGMTPNVTPDIDGNLPLYFQAGDFLNSPLPKTSSFPQQLGLGARWIFLGPGSEFFNFDEGPSKGGIKIHERNGNLAVLTPQQYSELIYLIKPNGVISLYSQIPFWASTRQIRLRSEASTEYVVADPNYITFTNVTSQQTDFGLFMQIGEITEEIQNKIKEALSKRPESLPRILLFDGHPADLRMAIDLGFDLLIPYLPIYYAHKGHAFVFKFDDNAFKDIDLDLKSREFEHDHSPVVEGCECRLCRDHKRSYIHHLLNVHEMLADTLFIEHNFYHYQKYVEYIRTHYISPKH